MEPPEVKKAAHPKLYNYQLNHSAHLHIFEPDSGAREMDISEVGDSWLQWLGDETYTAFVDVCELAEMDVELMHEVLLDASRNSAQRRRRRYEQSVLPEMAA